MGSVEKRWKRGGGKVEVRWGGGGNGDLGAAGRFLVSSEASVSLSHKHTESPRMHTTTSQSASSHRTRNTEVTGLKTLELVPVI